MRINVDYLILTVVFIIGVIMIISVGGDIG
jgi:hypothetical protein